MFISIKMSNESIEIKSEEFCWKQENNQQQELDEKEQRVNKVMFNENVTKSSGSFNIHEEHVSDEQKSEILMIFQK